ncbi:MAG: DUF1223 domain-containing protein [Paracoccaceae bacterium]
MGRIICAIMTIWLLQGASAQADGGSPVVVELYTSQGCSSCPPADKILSALADRDDVIALALHVDYWDYIGWKDVFADPANTKRQKAYARAAGSRMVYTPQMVVEGAEHLVGHRPMELAELIQKHSAVSSPVTLTLSRKNGNLLITARAEPPLDHEVVMQLVRYIPEQTVDIKRGENAGRTISYSNIVTEWTSVAKWDGRAPFSMSFPAKGGEPVVAIVQEPGPGPILAAARLR